MIASKRRISVIRQLAESFRGFADALKAGLNFIHGNKLYAVLEISAWCSDAELKRAYYRLVREYHPDALAAGGYAGALVVQIVFVRITYIEGEVILAPRI